MTEPLTTEQVDAMLARAEAARQGPYHLLHAAILINENIPAIVADWRRLRGIETICGRLLARRASYLNQFGEGTIYAGMEWPDETIAAQIADWAALRAALEASDASE